MRPRLLVLAAAILLPGLALASTVRVPIRPPASEVAFDATSRFTDVHAEFRRVDGDITLDPANLGATRVHLVVDASSMDSGSGLVDRRLRSADFFDVERYPTIRFDTVDVVEQRSAGAPAGAAAVTVDGRFTLHGVTRDVRFPAEIDVAGASVTVRGGFTIRRSDYGITYRSLLNPGGETIRIGFVFRGTAGPGGAAGANRAERSLRSRNSSSKLFD